MRKSAHSSPRRQGIGEQSTRSMGNRRPPGDVMEKNLDHIGPRHRDVGLTATLGSSILAGAARIG